MCDRTCEIDVSHTLATHFRLRNLDTAFLADNTTMLQALVFAAEAFVVFDRAKNLRTEKTVAFRLERPVVDRLRLFDFAKRP